MSNTPYSIAILSGKGGVGKSNLSVNLGYALNMQANNVVLFDCDMGLANIDILLGISPDMFLQHLFLKDTPLRDIVFPIAADRDKKYDLIPANSGLGNFAELDADTRDLVCDHINPFATDYDTVLMDIAAGISRTALDFSSRADMRLVVVTPEPTSVTDSYALMKVMHNDMGISSFHIVINQSDSEQEALATYNRLAMVCEHFLGFKPAYLGCIANDPAVHRSVTKQKPFILNEPDSAAARGCHVIAQNILAFINNNIKPAGTPALSAPQNSFSKPDASFLAE